MDDQKITKWLLLIHQIPPKPNYFRVKIWRRLQKIGAVAIKQSVYVLPDNEQAYEDLYWTVKEISEGGGTASLSRTIFLEGISSEQIESLFQAARNDEYGKIVQDTQSFIKDSAESLENSGSTILKKKRELSRIQNKFNEITAIDFFNAPGRVAAENILMKCDALLRKTKNNATPATKDFAQVQNKTWVTRTGIYVDRIASAWLIRRFIDPEAQLKFVDDEKYVTGPDELRFDMFEGEFSHIGDNCTFEVLANTFDLLSKPITTIAEIVHNIDLKDKKFSRPEMIGVQAVFSGMAATCSDDEARLERGFMIFDELYASFKGTT